MFFAHGCKASRFHQHFTDLLSCSACEIRFGPDSNGPGGAHTPGKRLAWGKFRQGGAVADAWLEDFTLQGLGAAGAGSSWSPWEASAPAPPGFGVEGSARRLDQIKPGSFGWFSSCASKVRSRPVEKFSAKGTTSM